MISFVAIWDTGATNSVITQKVIEDCGLIATGIAQVQGVHGGPTRSDTYLVNIALPQKVVFTGVRVTKGTFIGGDVLIGMDIITQGDFAVTNYNGLTKFSFRTPSMEHIDFVPATNPPPQSRAERRRAEREQKKSGR